MDETGDDDSLVLHHGVDGKSLSIAVECLPFDFEGVARALARMALFFLSTAADSPHLHVLRWVRGETKWSQPSLFELFLPGQGVFNAGFFALTAPPSDRPDQSIIAGLVFPSVSYFLPLPKVDWTVASPPWNDVLESLGYFESFSSNPSLTEYKGAGVGKIIGFRRTIRLAQKSLDNE
jgi:hypothetical protein